MIAVGNLYLILNVPNEQSCITAGDFVGSVYTSLDIIVIKNQYKIVWGALREFSLSFK